jgi:hypothetical protein
MTQTRISEPKGLFSLYGVLCVYLAIMVFAWGTSYKLSLYNPGHESSPAKMCMRGSDAAKSALGQAAGAHTLSQMPLRIMALFSLPQGTGVRSLDRPSDEAVSDLSPLSQAPILYLRPPPDERRPVD